MGYIFTKCERQRVPRVCKSNAKKDAALNRLRSFLDTGEPLVVQWLNGTWDNQQAAITYRELREFAINGWIPDERLEKWQNDYATFVNEQLAPQWANAIEQAASSQLEQYPYFYYDPSVGAAQEWIKQHGAELVTNLTDEQRNALQAMIGQATHYSSITADSLSRIMRPVIGLTAPQALANLRYWNTMWGTGVEAGLSSKAAETRAHSMAATYAQRQHRQRAFTIARTELATAYNQGAYGAILDAQDRGYIGDCKKTWLTADDERVCATCGSVDEESVNMTALFSNGVALPPAHPNCRCAVAYDEVSEPIITTETTEINTPATNNPLTYESNRDIIETGGELVDITHEMAGGLRRSPFNILTDNEIEALKLDIAAIKADVSVFRFNAGHQTSYSDKFDEVRIRGDVFPDQNSLHPTDLMSARAVLAHEYYGHRPYKDAKIKLTAGSWNDEFRASYMAAKNSPGLADDDRRYLILDALERAKRAGVGIKYNQFIRRMLYGY